MMNWGLAIMISLMGKLSVGVVSIFLETNMATIRRSEPTEKSGILPKVSKQEQTFLVTVCKDVCKDIKCRKGSSHYSKGHRYCPKCVAFFETKRIRCECCGSNLRLSGRN